MKLDPLFKSENNKLYTLDGKEVAVANAPVLQAQSIVADTWCGSGTVCAVELPWNLVGTEAGGYNEEFLASLRDWLKGLEEKERFVFFIPVAGKNISGEDAAVFTASMKHCARRIKDCTSVIGFAIPQGVDASSFTAELHEKHAQYILFSRDSTILCDKMVVLY